MFLLKYIYSLIQNQFTKEQNFQQMKQIKSYNIRINELKTQFKNIKNNQQQLQYIKNSFIPSKQRIKFQKINDIKQEEKLQKTKSEVISKSIFNSFTYQPKLRTNLRYHSKSISEQKKNIQKSKSNIINFSQEKNTIEELKKILSRSKQRNFKKKQIKNKRAFSSLKNYNQLQQINTSELKSTILNIPKNTQILLKNLRLNLQPYPIIKLNYGYRTRQGVLITNPDKVNQDSLLIKSMLSNKSMHLFAVADGHGSNGHQISQIAAKNLSKLMELYLKSYTSQKAFILSYYKLQEMINQNNINSSCSGTTLVSILIKYNEVICANVGDSRAIIAKKLSQKKWEIVQLSKDHKPMNQNQKNRIIKYGGRIQPFRDQNGMPLGPLRVWLPDKDLQGLAMTRSLGDNISKSIGVTCQPELYKYTLEQNNKFMVIGSDGIWEFLSNQQVVQCIIPFFKQKKIQQACDNLLQLAYAKWTLEDDNVVDDITFILIFFDN